MPVGERRAAFEVDGDREDGCVKDVTCSVRTISVRQRNWSFCRKRCRKQKTVSCIPARGNNAKKVIIILFLREGGGCGRMDSRCRQSLL